MINRAALIVITQRKETWCVPLLVRSPNYRALRDYESRPFVEVASDHMRVGRTFSERFAGMQLDLSVIRTCLGN